MIGMKHPSALHLPPDNHAITQSRNHAIGIISLFNHSSHPDKRVIKPGDSQIMFSLVTILLHIIAAILFYPSMPFAAGFAAGCAFAIAVAAILDHFFPRM